MLNYQIIESKDNSQVKYVTRLAKESKFRQEEQKAVLYGVHLLIEALKFNLVDAVFIHIDKYDKYSYLLEHSNTKILLVDNLILTKMNVLESDIDLLTVIKLPINKDFDNHADCVVLENIQDPGNLGTILRAASASGVDQVVISKGSVDLYNPKVLRASQGIQFAISIYDKVDIEEVLKNYHGQIFALTPHATNSLYQCDLSKPSAFVLGNEGNGLSQKLLNNMANHINIPMCGDAESLNLAMAATVALFEMSRQRIKV